VRKARGELLFRQAALGAMLLLWAAQMEPQRCRRVWAHSRSRRWQLAAVSRGLEWS